MKNEKTTIPVIDDLIDMRESISGMASSIFAFENNITGIISRQYQKDEIKRKSEYTIMKLKETALAIDVLIYRLKAIKGIQE
jgi:hypothetical protein